MSNNGGNANVSNPSDPMSSAFADCRTRVKLFCRFVIVVGFLGIIFYFTEFGEYLYCCPSMIWSSYGIGLYRIFTSFLVAGSVLSGFFALLSLGMTLASLEEAKGTLSCAVLVGTLIFSTNIIVTVISFLCYIIFGDFALGCTYEFWPAVFGLMVLDCMSNPDGLRNLCCLPIQVKSKFYPWIMLLIFTLMTQSINAGMFGGLLVGYLLHFKPQLQLSIQTATRWENRISWIQSWDGYIPVSASGVSGGGGDGGSWAYGNRQAESQADQAAAAPARPSVFSGQGHRLGGGPAQPASFMSSILPSSLSSSSAGGATGGDAPTVASMDPAAQAAARAKRAAAFEKRMSKASSSSSSSSTTATKATSPSSKDVELTSIQVVPSNSTVKYDHPPSPSRITSATSSSLAAPSAVFQIGDVDSDDDIYAVDDDNTTSTDQARQQEQRNVAADKLAEALNSDDGGVSAAPGGSKFPSPDAAIDGEFDPDQEAQGFDSGNKKKGLFSKLKAKASSSSSGYDKLQRRDEESDEEDENEDTSRSLNDDETTALQSLR